MEVNFLNLKKRNNKEITLIPIYSDNKDSEVAIPLRNSPTPHYSEYFSNRSIYLLFEPYHDHDVEE